MHEPPKPTRKQILSRSTEILGLVIHHGFGYVLASPQKRLARWNRLWKKKPPREVPANRWVSLRRLLEDLGPTFIKMGQLFSNRPDLLPEELIVELRKLRDQVPPIPFDQVRSRIEEDFDRPLEEIFSHFDPEPLASASIAVVHKAVLKTGETVAVKVMRPAIEERIRIDLEILGRIGLWFEKLILRSDVIDTAAILKEFSRTIQKELDFKNEAQYLEKFAANFQGEPHIVVPACHRQASGRHVLTMGFIDGFSPDRWESYDHYRLDRKLIARRGADLLLRQIFVHGFFHADPHPGNLLILPDGRICFLDFGMMGVIFQRHRETLAEMLLAVSAGDSQVLTRALLELSQNPEPENLVMLEEDVFALLETISHLPLKDIDLGAFLERTVSLILQHRLVMPANLYLLLKALLTIEGFARSLDPDFDLLSHLEPFVKEVLTNRFNPLKATGQGAESLMEYLNLAQDLPEGLREALKQIKKGKIKLDMDQTTLDQILHKADRISNRLAFSLVVTGGLVASSMALQSKIPPLWNDIPIIAIIGYIGSGIMGFALLISIWRSGRF